MKDSNGNIPYFKYRGAAGFINSNSSPTPQPQVNPTLPVPAPKIDAPQPTPPPAVLYGKISIDTNGIIRLNTATAGTYSTGSYKATFFFKRKNYEILEKGVEL